MIDAYSSLRHYYNHLRPIWDALPAEVRGTFWAPSRQEPWGQALHRDRDVSRLVLIAGARDGDTIGDSPLVYVEHGAGQTYAGVDSPSYSGGPGHDRVVLFLCPNEHVAGRWRAAYPDTRAEVVGCSALDRWHERAMVGVDRRAGLTGASSPPSMPYSRGPVPTVAVTFHWDCGLVPETRTAWRHYDRALPGLVADPRWVVLGHAHPRLWGTLKGRWRALGVEATPDLDVVMDRADLLVGDNSSALYEFASTGRPVLCLNQPGYRRHVEHGLRFWSHPPGLQCDTPAQLPDATARALEDPPAARAIRARAVARAYSQTDGRATQRAVTAILETHDAIP